MAATIQIPSGIKALLKRGVVLLCPSSVEVGDEVDPHRIAPGVVIHTGCKILGAKTAIGPGCIIGKEAPAAIEDCQLGQNVELKGGYFSGATFLGGSSMGSSAHVRSGTILEEEAGGAHGVGFKQTILFPFVTAGSLINFCDCLIAGGTSRKNHSEIGSSYIHFNFTPHGDKATASLIGDVPRGVMLDRPPVFLGGQGGLVGPARIGFGTVVPAGVICRVDVLEDGMLLQPDIRMGRSKPYQIGAYRDINRILANCVNYIGNIRALQNWYRHVRKPFMANELYTAACYEGALSQFDFVIAERIKRLKELAGKMPRSLEIARSDPSHERASWYALQETFQNRWPEMEAVLSRKVGDDVGARDRDTLLQAIQAVSTDNYLEAIHALPSEAKKAGTAWLKAIVDSASGAWDRRP